MACGTRQSSESILPHDLAHELLFGSGIPEPIHRRPFVRGESRPESELRDKDPIEMANRLRVASAQQGRLSAIRELQLGAGKAALSKPKRKHQNRLALFDIR